MRQLFLGLATAAALLASQNSAQAIFEKNLVDNFDDPLAVQQQSEPGGTTVNLTAPSEAQSRTLTGAGGVQAALKAGQSGPLSLSMAANTTAEVEYVLGATLAAAMAANNSVYLVLVNSTFVGGSVDITAYDDGGSLGTIAYSGESNAILAWGRTEQATSGLRFVFESGDAGFAGSVDRVVANPEPATMALMGLGVLGGAIGYRRRRKEEQVAPVEEAAPVGA